MHLDCLPRIVVLTREYMSSAVNALRKSLKTFHVTKRDFSNSITFILINQYDKDARIKIESVFRPVYMWPVEGSSQMGAFRHLSKHVFRGR